MRGFDLPKDLTRMTPGLLLFLPTVDVKGRGPMGDTTHFEQVPLKAIEQQIAAGQIAEFTVAADDPKAHSQSEGGLRYPEWQRPLHEALLELDEVKLKERLTAAQAAIARRLQSISQEPGNREEQLALADALSSLRILKRDIRD